MTAEPPPDAKSAIRQRAQALGFDAVGFARADADPGDRDHLAAFIAEGRHGDMTWMEGTADRRAVPRAIWPDVRSIVAVGMNYGPASDPMAQVTAPRGTGAVSVYAQGRDYHKVLKSRLKALGLWLARSFSCSARVYVDTAPVMEKPVAMRAGLGWIGKHTNLVSRRFGSWLFLGEVFTDLDLPPDPAETDHCGACDRCLRACPTGALPEPYRIDPRRCISYLTIEHKGPVRADLRPFLGNRVYGCDDCLAACPWTKFASPTRHEDLRPRDELAEPRLADLAELDEAGFRALTQATAIRRTGRERFVRNVMIAIGNSGNPTLSATALRRLSDPSPLVREAAQWALQRLHNPGTHRTT